MQLYSWIYQRIASKCDFGWELRVKLGDAVTPAMAGMRSGKQREAARFPQTFPSRFHFLEKSLPSHPHHIPTHHGFVTHLREGSPAHL